MAADDDVRVLTLMQPWAQLVALGRKRIETRSWGTRWRGTLAIHAGVSLTAGVLGTSRGGLRGLEELCVRDPFYEALRAREPEDGGFTGGYKLARPEGTEWVRTMFPLEVPLGRIVAVCELENVIPVEEVWFDGDPVSAAPKPRGWLAEREERAFGDYSRGRYAWLLGNVRRLPKPIPYKNGQGLRRLDRAQLPALGELGGHGAPW